MAGEIFIADKGTLDLVKQAVGDTSDTGGTTQTGTVMGKLNAMLSQGDVEQTIEETVAGIDMAVRALQRTVTGEATPYGTGIFGDVVYNAKEFSWGSQDFYGRYVFQCKSFTLPENITMKPPSRNGGVYIFSQGDVVLNGIMNFDSMGGYGPTSALDYIEISD